MRQASPFPCDPEVMARILRMTPSHVPHVARLHHQSMGTSLWARLGVPFLEALYRGLLADPGFVGYVYLEDGHVGGFIAGTDDASLLFRRTLLRHAAHLLLPTIAGLIRQPSLLLTLLSTPLYFGRSSPSPAVEAVKAESLFCSFAPALRGKRIAAHINKVLFDEMARRGHRRLKITTEQSNQPAIRQLTAMELEPCGTFSFYGKVMVAYVLDLERSSMVTRRP